MPVLNIRGAHIFHEVYGDSGPWLALNSGGRHRYLEMAPLAQAVAAKGFRVLVHDRRNTGASDIIIGGEGSEEDIWADDLHALLTLQRLAGVFGRIVCRGPSLHDRVSSAS